MKYYAGVELKETVIRCSIIARDGTLLCRDKVCDSGEGTADSASKLISMLVQRANVELSGIGIVYAASAAVQDAAKSAALIAEEVGSRFSAPVLLLGDFNVNDFDAAVFGD